MKYIFPDFLGNTMKKVPMEVQYQSSMLSMTLLLVSIMLTSFYMAVFMNFEIYFRVMMVINGICAFILMSSNLVTTYQQYDMFKETMDMQKTLLGEEKVSLPKRKINRKNQIMFFGGILLIIVSLFFAFSEAPYKWLDFSLLLVLGVLMIYYVFRKPKQKKEKENKDKTEKKEEIKTVNDIKEIKEVDKGEILFLDEKKVEKKEVEETQPVPIKIKKDPKIEKALSELDNKINEFNFERR